MTKILMIMTSLLLLTACSTSSSDDNGGQEVQQPSMLSVYVSSPLQQTLTRADVGEIDAIGDESKVVSMQIWIYENKSGRKVGHLKTTETVTLNMSSGAVYQIPVDDAFAKNKPNVDVYVVANVTNANCGVEEDALSEASSWDKVQEKAKIDEAHFGLTTPPTTEVPTDGLPMSGILEDQPIAGDAPVLRVGTTSQIAYVPLTRAVSKIRFVFANTAGTSDALSITDITLSDGMIPKEEYLFPNSQQPNYNSEPASLLSTDIDPVKCTANPATYVYNGETQTAQQYEELIATGISSEELSPVGPYYLRESNKRLEGTITYKVGNGIAQTATFRMSETGDFKRNHSWIVYAYYEGLSGMQVVTVDVLDWVPTTGSHIVHNW